MQKLRRPMGSLSDPVWAVFVCYALCEDRTPRQGRVAAVENASVRKSGKADSLHCEFLQKLLRTLIKWVIGGLVKKIISRIVKYT